MIKMTMAADHREGQVRESAHVGLQVAGARHRVEQNGFFGACNQCAGISDGIGDLDHTIRESDIFKLWMQFCHSESPYRLQRLYS